MEVDTGLMPCPLCQIPHFENVHSLRSTLISAATKQLICPVCNESLLGLDKLTIHLFSHMSVNIDKSETSPTAVENQEVSSKRDDVSSLRTNDLENASLQHVDVGSDTIVCDICDFAFTDQTILDLHQKLLHQTNPDKETGVYNFHCHLCSKKFKMRGSLIVHLRVAHYGFSKSNTENNLGKIGCDNGKENPKFADSKQWECDICCKMFTTKYFLKKHKRLHTGEMPYTCTQCNKSFTFQQSYHKHMLYHSSEKPYSCNECGRSFKELSTLQNHARIHSGERPFRCETCGKCFRQRVSYLVHRRIHTGAMPYDCKVCGKRFRYKVSQRSHKCSAINSSSTSSSIMMSSETPSISFKEGNNLLSKKDESTIAKCSSTETNDYQCFFNYSMKNSQGTDNLSGTPSSSQDLYSMILSPLLLDVESLCLTNSTGPSSNGTKIETQHNSENIFNNANFIQRNCNHS